MANAILLEPAAMGAVSAPGGSAAGFDPAVVANDFVGVVWRAPTGNTASLQVDLGADVPVNTIALFGLLGALGTAMLTVRLATAAQGPGFGSSWTDSARSLLAGANPTRRARGRGLWIAPGGIPAAARYLRLEFSGLGGVTPLSVGRLVVGARIALQRNFSFGAVRGVRSLGNVDWSVQGVPLVRRGAKLRTLGLSFNAVYADEVEGAVQPLIERVGNDTPIVLVTDPDPHADRQNRIYFGYLDGSPGTVQARAGSYQSDFAMVAID